MDHLWVVEKGGGRWKKGEKTTAEAKKTVWKRTTKEMWIYSSALVADRLQVKL